jgi:hypothetical protein
VTREELVEKYDRDLRLAKNQRDKALHYIEQAREDLQEAERALSMWTTALEDSNGSIELSGSPRHSGRGCHTHHRSMVRTPLLSCAPSDRPDPIRGFLLPS